MREARKAISFHSLEIQYLKGEIESHNNEKAKRALQYLCQATRSGTYVNPIDLNGLETSILGALVRGSSDEKVRRWSLSAISQIGRANSCLDAVKHVLSTRDGEPQVLSAAIAALFRLAPKKAAQHLASLDNLDPKISYLSALQIIPQGELSDNKICLEFESCGPLTLKLALLLAGMNKCPPNLFHPKFDNREIIRELSTSDDNIVAQYSVWAAAENPYLTSSDLGLDVSDIEGRSENQRSYIYRLYASDPDYSTEQREIIQLGADDQDVEARLGCAIGIMSTWFDGLEEITRDWYFRESEEAHQLCLLDHFVKQSTKSDAYFCLAVELYEGFENDSARTKRMLAQASRLPISTEFRKIDIKRESGSLFPSEVIQVSNKNYTFPNASFQGQTVIGGGENNNSGNQFNETVQDNRAIITATLSAALEDVARLPIESTLKDETIEAIKAAKEDASPSRLEKAANLLQACEKGLSAVSGMVQKAKPLGEYALALLQNAA
ncbi:hypothetical protein [Roseovarius nanhaiticus]|uniref:hypothetical protein n=1 Tax=Roseovarius nanhaiticus TaxID=573024 RepID=UPI00248F82B0|nr:hypothetical protein [Roseovarius nanhaiticus]